tara:strand:+ start:2029 stop:2406 length:378 start_codon:yes stop_codon:yes gene_type:complete
MKMQYKYKTIQLYEYIEIAIASRHNILDKNYADTKTQKKSFNVFGTETQIEKFKKNLPVDEVYGYHTEKKDSYYAGISFQYSKEHERYDADSNLPTLEKYNEDVTNFLNKLEKKYIENNCELLVL